MDINHQVYYTTRSIMGRTIYEFSPCFRVMESFSEISFLNARINILAECKRTVANEFWKCFYGDIAEKLMGLIRKMPLPGPPFFEKETIQEANDLLAYINGKRVSAENFEYVESISLGEMQRRIRSITIDTTQKLHDCRKELQAARQETAHWKAICRNRNNAKRRKNNRREQKCRG